MDFGFEYIIKEGGICTEASYPYEAQDDTCRADKCTDVVKVSSFVDVGYVVTNVKPLISHRRSHRSTSTMSAR